MIWVGKKCGVVSEPEPSSADDYQLGDEDECVCCDSPVEDACLAVLVEDLDQ